GEGVAGRAADPAPGREPAAPEGQGVGRARPGGRLPEPEQGFYQRRVGGPGEAGHRRERGRPGLPPQEAPGPDDIVASSRPCLTSCRSRGLVWPFWPFSAQREAAGARGRVPGVERRALATLRAPNRPNRPNPRKGRGTGWVTASGSRCRRRRKGR